VQGNHKIAFIDNNYERYDHAVHAATVKEHRPKYATVRDVMTRQQCAAAGIQYFELEQILEWAEELREYAQHVIVIPKYECMDKIPEYFQLGYSVPSSHGATPLSHEAFRGRRVHLLGGSWKMQLGYMAVLGSDVVSLDNNYVHKIANYGQFVTEDGDLRNVSSLGLGRLNNPRYVAMVLSFGLVSSKLNELFPKTVEAEDDAQVHERPEDLADEDLTELAL
jgi:hypothetical protein